MTTPEISSSSKRELRKNENTPLNFQNFAYLNLGNSEDAQDQKFIFEKIKLK